MPSPATGVPPVVQNLSPDPILGPIGRMDVVSFDVININPDDGFTFRDLVILAYYAGTDKTEVVFDGTVFTPFYNIGSTQEPVFDEDVPSQSTTGNGFTFTLVRAFGWPSAPTFFVHAFDGGQENNITPLPPGVMSAGPSVRNFDPALPFLVSPPPLPFAYLAASPMPPPLFGQAQLAFTSSTQIQFDIINNSHAFVDVLVLVYYPSTNIYEVVFVLGVDGSGLSDGNGLGYGFSPAFAVRSTVESMTGPTALHFTLNRDGGWPAFPQFSVRAVYSFIGEGAENP